MSTAMPELFNRITHKPEKDGEAKPIIGLYTLNQSLIINGIECDQGNYLCPSPIGVVTVDYGVDILRLSGDRLPSEEECDAITALMGELIRESDKRSWRYLIDRPVFFPAKNPEGLKLQPVEQFLQQHLVHVQMVNRHPRTHLQTEIELTSSAQARRIPSHAYQHLAAHSENWAYQRFSKVVPRRILSITTEDRYRIYENLVTASLTVQLYRDLSRREQTLGSILDVLASGENHNPRNGHYRKLHRQYELLRELLDLIENPAETLRHAMEQIAAMRQQIGALADETLIRQIPEAHDMPVPASLRATNIFVNDKHYRYIRLLWEKHQKQRVRKSPEQMQREWQDLHHAYEVFCLTLIVRALQTLHLSPADEGVDSLLVRGAQLRLKHEKCPEITIDLQYTDHGIFEIIMQQKTIGRVVPLLEPLAQDAVTAAERFETIDAMTQSGQSMPTYILYPGLNHELEQLTGDTRNLACDLGNGESLQNHQQAGFIPISPNDLDSIERVGRALRWIIWSALFASYPFQIQSHVPRRLLSQIAKQAPSYLRYHDDNNLHLTALVKLEQRATLTDWMKTLKDDDKRTPIFSDYIRQDFENKLESAAAQLETITHCPICGNNSSRAFKAREGNRYFICGCDSCNIQWGTNDCGTCHKPIPFIKFEVQDVKRSSPDWISAAYGMDVLAVPTEDYGHFVCPHCTKVN